MNGPAVASASVHGGASGGDRVVPVEAELNSKRIGMVVERLSVLASARDTNEPHSFSQLCLSLASDLDMMVEGSHQISIDGQGSRMPLVQRGIDYGVATNEVPDQASTLPPILKKVCRQTNELFLRASIMVLMISVKNACKMGWFSAQDTEELLKLAKEVGSYFGPTEGLNNEATSFLPTVSTIMSRFYPRLKLGHIIASLEVKPGYGTYAVDFHISKNVSYSPHEKIRLLVAMKDNVDTSSCIISPQHVNLLLNGRAVERRTNCLMDSGPQLPTIVNHLLKYGTNLLQAVGQFNGHYIILIAFMSPIPTSDLPVPQDYVQPDIAALNSGADSEIVEGPSRISLNCPISYRRIKTPVKGLLCKHYQWKRWVREFPSANFPHVCYCWKCFDFSDYVEMNLRRPSWRCPHCNQPVCFTDLRVDKNMVKVLQEVGESVSEVVISVDGSWAAAAGNNHKDESQVKISANQQEGHEKQGSPANGHISEASCNVYDLTKEDDEMETVDRCEAEDTKPVIRHNVVSQPTPTSSITPPSTRCTNEFNQYSSTQAENGLSSGAMMNESGAASYIMRSEAQNFGGVSGAPMGNFAMSPVLTDAVSPVMSRQPDNFQGTNYPTSSNALGQFAAPNSLQLQNILHAQAIMSNNFNRVHQIPRNVSRTPSAIQALPVQTPTPNLQQHSMPAMGIPTASGSSVPYQMPHQSNANIANSVANNIERQRHLQQSYVNPVNVSNMAAPSVQNHYASQVGGLSTPSHLNYNRMPQTLSQPPHLARSSQVSRNHVQQGVSPGAVGNSPSSVQRVQLTPQQSFQMRQPQSMPLQSQTQPVRMTSSMPQTLPPQRQTQPVRMATSSVPTQPVRMASSSVPPNSGVMPQAVTRTENLIDLQSDQSWRPTGRMRGSLTGQAYSAALNQFMGQATQQVAQAPIPRPPMPAAAPLTPQIQVLLANRMNAQSRTMNDAANPSAAGGTQPQGPNGVN